MRPGSNKQAGLVRGEADRLRRAYRRTCDLAGRAVDARRDVDREHRPAHCVEHGRRHRGDAIEPTPESGAVHRVDHEVGAVERTLQLGLTETRFEHQLVDAHARFAQAPCGDPAVGAVVALARDHGDPPAVGAAEHSERVTCDRSAGPLHEHRFGCAGRDRVLVGLGHLGRRQHELHLLLPVIGQPDDGLGEQLDETDAPEHVVAHDRLDLRHLVGDRLVTIAVPLEHPARGIGRQPVEEAHVQAA